MNEFNDRGERHGYWEYMRKKVNYYNGEIHGHYENYWDDKFKRIFCKGKYNMIQRIGQWVWYDSDGKSLYRKEFYL